MQSPAKPWRRWLFLAVWLLTSGILVWLLAQGHRSFDSPGTLAGLAALFLCTVSLLLCISHPRKLVPSTVDGTRWVWFLLLALTISVVLFAARTVVGPPLLYAFPVAAAVVLLVLRPGLSRVEVAYALVLALVAGVTGLGAQWVTMSPPVWAALQVALVLPGLLAGWALLRRTGLWEAGFGRALFVEGGMGPALRAFGRGALIAVPWALGLIVMGSAEGERWVHSWWQPIIAIQPAIAEEAWGRVLLVPLLYIALRRFARGRTALTAAIVISAYWFAYLHTAGGFGSLFSTLMIGTLFALPTTYVWLHEGLETAIGFHFCLDFVKFAAAYVLSQAI